MCTNHVYGAEAGMGRKILLVEDDRETASYLAKGLGLDG